MKSILFSLISLLAVVGMTSCGGNNDSDVRRNARESLNVNDNPAAQPATSNPNAVASNPAATPPAATGTGVHYICPNNCEGSGGDTQVACPVCGTQYVHNQAFHASQQTTPPATTNTTPATPPAAQNAAGVYHYTCSNGCAGGGAAAGSCATCGSALAHNTAFHNN